MAALLLRVGLLGRKDHEVRVYSSGMKQRLKYACALLHRPHLLILDEPMSNLDHEGVEMVLALMQEQLATGMLVVSTNEERDTQFCGKTIDLNVFSDREGRAR